MSETAHHVAPGQERRVVVMDGRGPDNRLRPGRDSITLELRDGGKLFAGGQGLVTTMSDYLRFTQMLLNGGTLDGHRVLKRESAATMMQNHLPPRLTPLANAIDMKGYGQGYGGTVLVDSALSQMPASPGTYRWCGYAGTYFWIDPRRDLIAMLWGQLAGGCPHPVAAEFERMVYAAVTGK
jgi:CubicO group peptidase (beta-lactamase class C family)